jgi:hypothetical protein
VQSTAPVPQWQEPPFRYRPSSKILELYQTNAYAEGVKIVHQSDGKDAVLAARLIVGVLESRF